MAEHDEGSDQSRDRMPMDTATRRRWLSRPLVRTELLHEAGRYGLAQDAEDLYQDWIANKLENVALRYDSTSESLGFAVQSFRNLCLDLLRKRRAEQQILEFRDPSELPEPSIGFDTALALLEADDDSRLLDSAMSRLSPEDREALTAFYWDDRDCAGIAFLQGKKRNAVKIALHRARLRLRELLADEAHALSLKDIKDWGLFISALSGIEMIGAMEALGAHLPEETRTLLVCASGTEIRMDVRRSILSAINQLLRQPDIFATSPLREAAAAYNPRMRLPKSVVVAVRMNRVVLEAMSVGLVRTSRHVVKNL